MIFQLAHEIGLEDLELGVPAPVKAKAGNQDIDNVHTQRTCLEASLLFSDRYRKYNMDPRILGIRGKCGRNGLPPRPLDELEERRKRVFADDASVDEV